MKFKFLTKKLKLQKQLEEKIKWHKAFAWKPTRVSDTRVVWLQHYYRRFVYPYREHLIDLQKDQERLQRASAMGVYVDLLQSTNRERIRQHLNDMKDIRNYVEERVESEEQLVYNKLSGDPEERN